VRYGPNRYSIDDPSAVQVIYGLGNAFAKSDWYSSWAVPGKDGPTVSLFSDTNVQRHGQNRRQYQSTYSMTSLKTYEPYVDECTDIFERRLREAAATNEPMDVCSIRVSPCSLPT